MRRDARSEPGSLRSVRDLGLLLFVAAALVVGLIHFSVARNAGGQSADASTAAATSSRASAPSSSPSASPVGSASTSSSSATGPVTTAVTPGSSPPAPATATCWNGDPAPRLAQCAQPSGVAGLRWVFPSLDGAGVSCHPASRPAGDYGTVIGRTCSARVAGHPVSITYEQVSSATEAATAIERSYARGERYQIQGARGGRTTWFDRTGRSARAVGYYQGYPYVVSLIAGRSEVAKQAWSTLVSFRPPGSVLGVRG